MQQCFDFLNLKEYWDYTSTQETAEQIYFLRQKEVIPT